jgi:hypothetical protein
MLSTQLLSILVRRPPSRKLVRVDKGRRGKSVNDELSTGLTAIAGAIISAVAVFIKNWTQKKIGAEHAVVDAAVAYQHLNEFGCAVNADRCLILYTSNGGGIPTAGKALYTTILYEMVFNHNLHPMRQMFQDVALDYAYVEMLQEVVRNGVWYGGPQDLKDGFLKSLYNEEGVTRSMVFKVAATKHRFYYVSARWTDTKPPTKELLDLWMVVLIANLKPVLTK